MRVMILKRMVNRRSKNDKQRTHNSEAWGPPQLQEKRSRSEKPMLGALGEFRGILGAALGVQKVILGMRNPILGMASHDLSNAKPALQFSEQLSERFPELLRTHPKDLNLPLRSRSFFSRIGVVPARQNKGIWWSVCLGSVLGTVWGRIPNGTRPLDGCSPAVGVSR